MNGVEGDTLQENTRLGATLALPVDRNNSIKFYASTGTYSRTGSDFDAVGVAWQYRWAVGSEKNNDDIGSGSKTRPIPAGFRRVMRD